MTYPTNWSEYGFSSGSAPWSLSFGFNLIHTNLIVTYTEPNIYWFKTQISEPFSPFSLSLSKSREKKKMRSSKTQTSTSLKLILICFLCLLLFLLVFKSSFTPFQENQPSPILETHDVSNKTSTSINPVAEEELASPECPSLPLTPTCTKTPPSLAQAVVHYATLNITPQQTFNEISVSMKVLQKKAPCNFLVFGLGHDSLMWTALNHGGRTIFLEEDKSWIEQIKKKLPALESYHVVYDSKVGGLF